MSQSTHRNSNSRKEGDSQVMQHLEGRTTMFAATRLLDLFPAQTIEHVANGDRRVALVKEVEGYRSS